MGISTWAEVKEYGLAEDVPRFVDALVAVAQTEGYWGNKLNELKKVLDVKALPCRTPMAVALSARIPQLADENARTLLEYVVDALIDDYGRTVDLAEAEAVLGIAARYWYFDSWHLATLGEIVLGAGHGLPDEVIAVMRRSAFGPYGDKTLKSFVPKIKLPLLNRGEPLADRVLDDLSTLGDAWRDLATHALTVIDDVPTQEWETKGRNLLASVGESEARRVITGWLTLVGKPGAQPLLARGSEIDVELALDPFNATAVRGLVWLLGLLPADAELARTLAGLVESNLRKVPGIGPRQPKAAGAAIHALYLLDGPEALAQLLGLATRVTNKMALQELNASLYERAEALNVTREQLSDLAVPGYGLAEDGRRTQHFGDDTATLLVHDGRVTIEWHNAAGVVLGSAPSTVKAGYAEELKELKATAAEIGKTLSAQTSRLQRDLTANRVWRFGFWRDHYLNHPLLGTLTRRLLWLVDTRPCGFADGALQSLDSTPIQAADTAPVQLWQPGGEDAEAALAWLDRHAIVPPFDQISR
ncbi:hypothetical protein Rhe02_46650 [Rhizocola hellebori]|uniref:DUF4132 domain-containing protein n=1 Tax=Rhizocola hellebori TaxID=1392758 RepID=A0A8J3VI54_9ACTN|nr:DUF4132 domain-containing protein [Rhizocola hellebori]GIH06598.1 hypothetical protein Rhe02_46650 [Rhizocola hellebori]